MKETTIIAYATQAFLVYVLMYSGFLPMYKTANNLFLEYMN